MRKILAAAAVAALAVGLSAQEPKKGTPEAMMKEGKFTAKFPGEAKTHTQSAAGITLHATLSENGKEKGAYTVIYTDLPGDKLKATTPAQVLESGVAGLRTNFSAEVTESKAAEFGPKKYPAREVAAERKETGFHLRGKVVLAGNRLYQVYVIGPKDFVTTKEADGFLGSFAVTD